MNIVKAVLATAGSCIGLYLGYRRFLLKEGIKIRGNWGTMSSIACEGSFVHRITLENRKDRAVTIYGVYLQVGFNYFVIVEDFGDEPLILKGFETFQKDYEPIDFYAINSKKVNLDSLLKDRSLKKRLVLSTSHGKYVVKKMIKRWDPLYLFFSNHYTGLVRPIRSSYEGKSYGGNVVFFVRFKDSDGTDSIVPIYPSDYQIRKFRRFRLTEESLKSKANLQKLLEENRAQGKFTVASFEVHDVTEMRKSQDEFYSHNTLDLPKVGWFRYRIIGPLTTRWSDWQLRRQNRKLQLEYEASEEKKRLTDRKPEEEDSPSKNAADKGRESEVESAKE